MRRLVSLVCTGIALLLLSAWALYLSIGRNARHDAKPVATAMATTRMPVYGFDRLISALKSENKERQAAALASPLQAPYSKQTERLIPIGSEVIIDQRTFRTSQFGAIIEAQVTGQGRFRLYLVREGDQWLVLETRRLP